MLRLSKVEKRYGSVIALQPLDLEVPKGEFITLLGPSGSGKTTILNMIAGVTSPTAGAIYLNGVDITSWPSRKRGLGMIFQNYALLPHLSVYENVAFPLRVRWASESEIRRRVSEVLEIVQLPHVTNRMPRELSGGQQQRVAIARSIVYDPPIILMDEPLGALDKALRDQIQLEIKRLHSTLGITVVYVTHDQEEALALSDRICLMNHGQIAQIGTPAELYFHPNSRFSAEFIGDSNLFDGVVIDIDCAVVLGPSGRRIRFAAGPHVHPDQRVKFMVRPEMIRILDDREDADNTIQGEVVSSIFVGGVTRVFVRLPDGAVVNVSNLTVTKRGGVEPGRAVRLGWSTEATVLLADGGN